MPLWAQKTNTSLVRVAIAICVAIISDPEWQKAQWPQCAVATMGKVVAPHVQLTE